MKYRHKWGDDEMEAVQLGDAASKKALLALGGDRISEEGGKLLFEPYPQPSYDFEVDKPEGQQNPHPVIYQPPHEEFEKGDWLMKLPDGSLHKFPDEDFKKQYVEVSNGS